jgi:hypothetical protein
VSEISRVLLDRMCQESVMVYSIECYSNQSWSISRHSPTLDSRDKVRPENKADRISGFRQRFEASSTSNSTAAFLVSLYKSTLQITEEVYEKNYLFIFTVRAQHNCVVKTV